MSWSISATAPKAEIREELAAKRNDYLAQAFPDGVESGLLTQIDGAIAEAGTQADALDSEEVSASLSGHYVSPPKISEAPSVTVSPKGKERKGKDEPAA